MKTRGYSIWLKPEGETRANLAEVIKSLSAKNGTPIFDPHVTLLGGILLGEDKTIEGTEEASRRIEPYTIELTGEVGYKEHWAKALFVRISETAAVLGANRVARAVCGVGGGEQYHPHLSLMYADDIPIDERKKIGGTLDTSIFTCRFSVDKLHLYRTEGSVEDWVKVGEFELTGH